MFLAKFILLAFGFITHGITDAISTTDDLQENTPLPFIKYSIPESLIERLNVELPLIIANGNYTERLSGYIQNPNNSNDKGNPNLIFLEKIGSVNRWSLLCLCADKGIEALVDLLRQNEADENYRDSYGITPLHRAAFYGYTGITQSLLRPMGSNRKKVNVLTMDHSGLTPRDYLRIALAGNIHGSFEIDSLLKTAEEYELESRKTKSIPLKNFINAFMDWSTNKLKSEQILSIGNIARANNILSFSNLFSVLSNVTPSGVSTVMSLAGVTASAVEGYIADKETKDFLDRTSGLVMDREFVKLVYYLADMCEESIEALNPSGAARLGKHAAKYVAEYMKRMNYSHPISFVEQVEQYFSTLEDPGYVYRKELDKEGEKWYVHAVLKRDAERKIATKTRRIGISTLVDDATAKISDNERFDRQEVERIELLLSGGIPSHVAIVSERMQPLIHHSITFGIEVVGDGTTVASDHIGDVQHRFETEEETSSDSVPMSRNVISHSGVIVHGDGTTVAPSISSVRHTFIKKKK